MRQAVLLVLLVLAVTCGCTRPPYSSPDKDLAAVENDFTDCYSRATLTANTPPYPDSPISVVHDETDTCMTGREYHRQLRLLF